MYRVIFMGTPDFAVPCLAELIAVGADIPCVVTQPDKPVGRKQKLTPPPVKVLAEENGIPVFQPATLKNDEAYEYIRSLEPDFIVVIAYGKILPKRFLDLPKIACVNVHGSLLPKYRGAAPIQRAVIQGEKVTGITTMKMDEGIDTGDMLLKVETPIGAMETAGELFDRLASMAPPLLLQTLDGLAKGEITPQPQNHAEATYAAMLSKQEGCINWAAGCDAVFSLVKGCNPWPVAYTQQGDKKIKIYRCEKTNIKTDRACGELYMENGKIYAVCADGVLHICELQAEGSKRMSDTAYANGHAL